MYAHVHRANKTPFIEFSLAWHWLEYLPTPFVHVHVNVILNLRLHGAMQGGGEQLLL